MKKKATLNIRQSLKKIDKVFALEFIKDLHFNKSQVQQYYESSNFGYKYIHSAKGSIHMALNFDGKYDHSGYFSQANFINSKIKEHSSIQVLELGCGKGFNTNHLASLNPGVTFTGIDITPEFIEEADRKSTKYLNVTFRISDYHRLPFNDGSVDLIFEIEAVCHSCDHQQVLSEAKRVLRKGGLFVLFDGFRQPGFEKLSSDIRLAAKMVEKSMAIDQGQNIDDWLSLAKQNHFDVELCEDISDAITPNLNKFYSLSKLYFKTPWMAKLVNQLLPVDLMRNTIAGLLMPYTLSKKAQGYYKIVLIKL